MQANAMASMGEALVHAFERSGARVAIECDGAEVTYAQLASDVARTIGALRALGLKPGDRIAQIAANGYEAFLVVAAAYVGGFTLVPLQYNGDLEDHRFAIEDSRPALVIVDAGRAGRAQQLAASCGHAFLRATHDELATAAAGQPQRPLRSFAGAADPQGCARLNYTGGTTGKPKGVMIASAALTYATMLHVIANGYDGDTRLLVASPISHGGGSFIPPVLWMGGRVVIHNGFDAARVTAEIASGRVNSLFLVPTMLYALLDHPDVARIQRGQLRRVTYGAAPASPARLRQALELFGPVLVQSYGQSEAPGAILYLSAQEHVHEDPQRLMAAGKPYPGVSIKLVGQDGQARTGSGEVGEICVRAPHVMLGYLNNPELTEATIRDGWLHTGNLARVDPYGFFHIVDRAKDMIISGGFNVYASEVESVLEAHPDVKASAVIGVPDERWGEAVKAFVVPQPQCCPAEADLIAFAKANIGSIKAPKTIEITGSLPVTKVGKIDKKALRAPYWEGKARGVN